MIRICIAGVTGWVGSALVHAVHESTDLRLVGAVSRSKKGRQLGEVAGIPDLRVVISGSVDEALTIPTDVLVDFTSPDVAKSNVLSAIQRGVHVVVGTSGLTDDDYEEIDRKAKSGKIGVIAAGNFAISAALMEHFATIAAEFMPSWEVIDYAKESKPDAPSGTAREVAHSLSAFARPKASIPIKNEREVNPSRGLSMGGTQVHSVRLPGYVIGTEVIFGRPGERLSIRHDASEDPSPYIVGVLLATRKVSTFVGLSRGLWRILWPKGGS